MADMQIRGKMKKIAEAAKHGENVPERSKKVGFLVFLLLIGIGVLFLFALAIGLFMNGHSIGAFVTFLIAAVLAYSIYKMSKADDIREL